MDDLKGLDASTGPFLKLLCLDGECSGRLECLTGNSHTGSVQAVRARL